MALSLITTKGPYELKERSAGTFRVSFRDQDANTNVVPTNCYYRLDDDGTGMVLTEWTPLSPMPVLPINYLDIPITAEQNRNIISSKEIERKTLSVMANRGLATQFVGTYGYSIRNLSWVS